MTQSAKTIGRRELLRQSGVAALAVAGAAVMPGFAAKAHGGFSDNLPKALAADPLLDGVERYLTEMVALNASRGLSDKQLDAWIDRADEILASALEHPVSSSAGALALLALVVQEGYNPFTHAYYGDELRVRCKEAVRFLASEGRP
jgi:hypothetical protein